MNEGEAWKRAYVAVRVLLGAPPTIVRDEVALDGSTLSNLEPSADRATRAALLAAELEPVARELHRYDARSRFDPATRSPARGGRTW